MAIVLDKGLIFIVIVIVIGNNFIGNSFIGNSFLSNYALLFVPKFSVRALISYEIWRRLVVAWL